MSWLHARRIHIALFICGLIGYGAVAGGRLASQSPDPHFVLQADAWLHGRLAIEPPPQKGDDWAILEEVELDDGTVVRGRRLATRPVFQTTTGEEIPRARIRRRVQQIYFVSFPPAPALLMVPSALIAGRNGNDVIPTVLLAALLLPLAFSTLRRLAVAGLSQRSETEDLWLVAAFGFGSVFYFAAVQGRVWFTAHVVGAALTWGYLYSSVEARRPVLAGLCLGLAALARVPLAFAFPLFAFEAWRAAGGELRGFVRRGLAFAAPILVLAGVAMALNQARWGSPLEFGHRYLNVRQQSNIEAHGLFDLGYLWRNLQVAFALLPRVSSAAPYVQISGHGLALWVTSPILLWVVFSGRHTRLHLPLWLTVAAVGIPTLLYQNTGWFQFGYRFSIDYLPYLFVLIALSKRPLGRLAKAAIVAGVVINLFGAITFARYPQFYRTDAASYRSISAHR